MRWPRALAWLLLLAPCGSARASEAEPQAFALVVGVNASLDPELAPLRYADDDAARYFDLLSAIGAKVHLLAHLDASTRRLHPSAAAAALEPDRTSLDRVIATLAREVSEAHEAHRDAEIYVFYAGHGSVHNGQGYVTLADARLRGHELAEIVRRISRSPRDHIHVVVDACDSYSFVFSRGPGGERRPLTGEPAPLVSLAEDSRVGLLLSTSSARESHEWEGFQAGVFSHEVRSGLFGAADANRDGRIDYAELGAYVERANAAVANDRFRPRVFARAPANTHTFLRLGSALGRRIEIGAERSGRYFVEDAEGVRLVDLHAPAHERVWLVRMPGRLYVRSVRDDREFAVAAVGEGPDVVELGALTPASPHVASRGAAHEAFSRLFALPFDEAAVRSFPLRVWSPPSVRPDESVAHSPPWRAIGWTAMAAGATSAGVGTAFAVAGGVLRASSPTSQVEASEANGRLATYRAVSTITWIAGAAVLAGGLAALLLAPSPHAPPPEASGD